MTQEEKRIRIAEACGWKRHPLGMNPHFWIHFPSEKQCRHDEALPDYFNDLNAMHEAEKVLTVDQLIEQAEWLGASSNEMPIKSWVVLLRATAAQRAEAFGLTLGLWTIND